MIKITEDFKEQDVVFCVLYTGEPHAGEKRGDFDFSDIKQTETHEDRVEYAAKMIEQYEEPRRVLIDTFGDKCLQKTLGGRMPNSLIVVDTEGKIALWQRWSNPDQLREKLVEMTGYTPPAAQDAADVGDAAKP